MNAGKPGCDLRLGSRIEVGVKGTSIYRGVIIQKRTVYDILYDDGDIGIGVAREIIKCTQALELKEGKLDNDESLTFESVGTYTDGVVPRASTEAESNNCFDSSDLNSSSGIFKVGDKIDSQCQHTQDCHIGTIISYVGDDKYVVKFERKENAVAGDDTHCHESSFTSEYADKETMITFSSETESIRTNNKNNNNHHHSVQSTQHNNIQRYKSFPHTISDMPLRTPDSNNSDDYQLLRNKHKSKFHNYEKIIIKDGDTDVIYRKRIQNALREGFQKPKQSKRTNNAGYRNFNTLPNNKDLWYPNPYDTRRTHSDSHVHSSSSYTDNHIADVDEDIADAARRQLLEWVDASQSNGLSHKDTGSDIVDDEPAHNVAKNLSSDISVAHDSISDIEADDVSHGNKVGIYQY